MMQKMLNILIVDDDDVAAESIIRGLRKLDEPCHMVVAEDGLAALNVLRHQDQDRILHRPYVVLLDLNMPRMDGFEFLDSLRSDPEIRDTVVFVLTTSTADIDRSRAYQQNIAGYMVKSSVGPQFSKLVRLMNNYRDAVRLP
jgi:CheY-like chemotaxis protein